MNTLDISAIEHLTLEYGEGWALAHVQRLLKLIEQIGAGLEYDPQAMQWAVYLHDWGAFPKYYQPGCEHALLSKQVAEAEILPNVALPEPTKAIILEAIELHDYRDKRPVQSNEALLLREADFLDFLGAIGIAREFARGPKDLQKSHKQILARKEEIKGRFTILEAKKLAEERLACMEAFLNALMKESFGYL
jgi:HD superfamily phosphodiesterase